MGYVRSIARVRRRFLRCEHAWAPHLIRTRDLIKDAAQQCERKRKVVLLGAGLLHDIPLKDLSQQFEEVILVDVVHPWHCRRIARQLPNVRLVRHDVTEVMDQVNRLGRHASAPLPNSRPQRFVEDTQIDLVVSVNLLSQLPVVPERFLKGVRSTSDLEAFGRHLIDAHLDYLHRLPGRVVLITDRAAKKVSLAGDVVDEWDILYGAPLPEPDQTWEWCLAPSPEQENGFHFIRQVVAYADWKRGAR